MIKHNIEENEDDVEVENDGDYIQYAKEHNQVECTFEEYIQPTSPLICSVLKEDKTGYYLYEDGSITLMEDGSSQQWDSQETFMLWLNENILTAGLKLDEMQAQIANMIFEKWEMTNV